MTDSPPPTPTHRTTPRQHAARWLLAATVFGSAMALGARHTTVLVIVTAVLSAASVCAWWGADSMRARPAATIVLWTGVALTAWTALQCVPMPASWLATIAPGNADVWARCLTPLHEPGPKWVTISLDPIATRAQVLRGVAYLLTFVTALRVAARREGVVFLEVAVIVTGVAIAVAAWLHPAVGAERVFGVYLPDGPGDSRHVAPILNPNMLAAYLNVAFCVALGEAIAARPSIPRAVAIAVVSMLFATQLWVASRGGMLGMGLGVVLVVWMTQQVRRDSRRSVVGLVVPAALVTAGIGMAVLTGSESAWQELASTDITKLQLTKQALSVVPNFPIFGMGRGAFESVFAAFRTGSGHVVFTHPEDLPAQWLTEWGVVLGGGGLVMLAFALRPGAAMARSVPAAGAWAAIACFVVHNLVDFSSELPAAVIVVALCAAMVVGGTAGASPRLSLETWSRKPSLVAGAGLAAAAASIALAAVGIETQLVQERLRLRDDAFNPSVSADTFHAEVGAAMARHPAEPYLPFSGALRASRARDESTIPWVERTLERAPIYGPAHFVLARELSRKTRAQARLEYRLAMIQDDATIGPAITEGASLVGGYYDALELVPDGAQGEGALEALAAAVTLRLPATRVRIDRELARRDSSAASAVLHPLRDVQIDLDAGDAAPWCAEDRAGCVRHGLELADRLEMLQPSKCSTHSLRAAIVAAAGDKARALEVLTAAVEKVDDRAACVRELVSLSMRLKDDERANQAIDRLARMGCSSDAECVENLVFDSNVELDRGHTRRALAFIQKARDKAPDNAELAARAGALASQLGLHAEALQAYKALRRLQPDKPAWSEAIANEEQAIVTEVIPRR